MPERFATMHIRQVNLDERDADARQSVADRDARMRVRGGIDQDEIGFLGPRGLDAVDERAFMIALKRREFDAGVRRAVGKGLIDLRQASRGRKPPVPGCRAG